MLFQIIVAVRVLHNYSKYKTLYDIQLLFLFVCAAGVPIFEQVKVFLILFTTKTFVYESIITFYGIGVLTSYSGFFLLSYLLFRQADKLNVGQNYWKSWISLIIITLTAVSSLLILNAQIIEIPQGNYYYISVLSQNIILNIVLLIICEIAFFPFFVKSIQLARSVLSKSSQRRIIFVGIQYELVGFITFFGIGFVNSMELVIFSLILEICTAIIAFYFFYPSNVGESLFIQLNIESIYIIDEKGRVLEKFTLIPGKNIQAHDKLVGGLVKASEAAISEIRNVKDEDLNRMILDDGTAIIIKHSQNSSRYYTLFTRNYTSFVNMKMIELRDYLDNLYSSNEENKVDLKEIVHKTFIS